MTNFGPGTPKHTEIRLANPEAIEYQAKVAPLTHAVGYAEMMAAQRNVIRQRDERIADHNRQTQTPVGEVTSAIPEAQRRLYSELGSFLLDGILLDEAMPIANSNLQRNASRRIHTPRSRAIGKTVENIKEVDSTTSKP